MFEHPGKRIKLLAHILFWFNLGFFFILAFFLGFPENRWGETVFSAIPFLVTLIGGAIFACVTGLLLYGYGELIDGTQSVAESVHNLTELTRKLIENTAEQAQESTSK